MCKKTIAFMLALALILSCVPTMAFAASGVSANLKVADVYATPGSTVTVAVEIENNPGILGATLTVSWDNGLTLVEGTSGEAFAELTYQAPSRYTNGCNFVWYGSAVKQVKDGKVLLLTFQVEDSAEEAKVYNVTVTYDSRDILDQSYNTVELNVENGSVRIVTYKPGDVSGDDRINPLDLIQLSQYISDGGKTDPDGFNVTINTNAADVNDDDRINPLDLILISQYISDGCKTDPQGYNVELKPHTPRCVHEMQVTVAKDATCTEDGNTAYWYCAKCGKYFDNAVGSVEIELADTVLEKTGHTVVVDEAVAPTPSSSGLTEGSHCSTCGEVLVAQEVIPPTKVETYEISYDIANGDPYLEGLLKKGEIVNPNKNYYEEGVGLTLANISVPGYRFVGWYDLAENGTLVKKIEATSTENYQLYAYWTKIEYRVQYKSSLFVDRAQDTYTVDTGLVLPTPKLSNYVFTGWADEDGKLYSNTMIPAGTTKNLVLEANWTSERNKTWTKTDLGDPIRYTEDNTMYFVYEIGEIQNVPLYTIKDFGYIAEGGVEKSEETKFSTVISTSVAEQIAESVEKATTSSSNWNLSSGWSESTDISQEWLEETGYERDEVIGYVTNEESNWNVSTGTNGSTDTSVGTSNEKGWTNESKITSSSSGTASASMNASLESTIGAEAYGVKAEISAKLETEQSVSKTNTKGMETGGSRSGTDLTTANTTTSSGWSNSSSYGGSKSFSENHSTSTSVSEAVTEKYGYGKGYTSEYTSGESQGLEQSNKGAKEWSSAVTYNTETAEEVTRSWTTAQTKAGYHRWIMAGIAHVFAVVAYDMETQSYYVSTYTVMDDKTYEYEDYSYTSATYNDHENGVLSFEIPYEVAEMVAEQTAYTQGLKVNQVTGIITGYTGTDNCVVIPEYMNVGGGDVIKIVGLADGVFQNNTNITAVVLSDFITEIPNDCFNGCTNLEGVTGGTITKIGDRALAGTAIAELAVRPQVTSVGESAFEGVERVYFNCANKQVLEAADNCGAKEIYIGLANLKSATVANGVELTIPAGTRSFEINGDGKTVSDMIINSDAEESIFTKINFIGSSAVPVETSSAKVVFNQSSIQAKSIALILKAESTELHLQSTVNITSENEVAILSKNVDLCEWNQNVDGHLAINDKMLYVGGVENQELIASGTLEQIDEETFENMLKSYTMYFNANGGTCTVESVSIPNNTKVGMLPVPTRQYYVFQGWFDAATGGNKITADTVLTVAGSVTVYAQWEKATATLTFNANGGSVSTASKQVYLGEKSGTLPTPTRSGVTFVGWFTADGVQVTENTVFTSSESVTLKAHWKSGWVLASNMPADGKVSSTKWTYTLTTRTTSNSSTAPAGYTSYKDATWVWGEYGAWSSWSKTAVTGSDSRKIETKTVTDQAAYTNYKYYIYRTSDGYGYGTKNYNTGSHGACTKYDEINLSYALPLHDSGNGLYGPYNSSMFSHSYDSYWFFGGSTPVAAVTHVEYRYADRSKVYTYYYQKVEEKESTTQVTASDTISNVQKWVQYVVE